MRHLEHALSGWAAAAILLGCMVGLAGCGSSDSHRIADSGSRQICGIAEAPAAQVAQATGARRHLAQLFILGAPAEADHAISRRPVRGGTVTLARLSDRVLISRTTTDANGNFTLTGVTPGATVEITVTAPGPQGQITLRRVVEADAAQTTVTVNEATTVGAEAAALVTGEGSDEEAAVQLAGEITEAQESAEAHDPAQIPDLHEPMAARQHAQGHLVGNLDSKLKPVFTSPTHAPAAEQALMAAQVYAHESLDLPAAVHLTRAQMLALSSATTAGKTFAFDTLADALQNAGVLETVSTEAIRNALAALKRQPKLNAVLRDIPADGPVPLVAALLLAEQVQAADSSDSGFAFAIRTQEQLTVYLQALTGIDRH